MTLSYSKKHKLALLIIAVASVIALYYGWRVFWFLTDDAFIAFRYISNSQLGHGYVWNAPPFRPVEGYTSFLWVVLLDVVWRITGVEPPAAANYVSLLFTYVTLLLGGLLVLRMNLNEAMAKHRLWFICLVFVGALTNRTFLAWSSSGLETAMFNFFLTLWIYCSLSLKRNSRSIFWLTLTSALLCLTRPDGLLFAAVSAAFVARAIWEASHSQIEATNTEQRRLTDRVRWVVARTVLLATPLLIIPAHILWRHRFYGAWLPNTYYAKTVAGRIWPQSGLRYFLSFVLEYSLWIWLLLLVIVLVKRVRRMHSFRELTQINSTTAAVCLAIAAHCLYYTIVIGGDHFEYRVYSQLVLLSFVTFLWLLNAVQVKAKTAALLCGLFIVLSWPIPWIHWAATHDLNTRRRTVVLEVSVAKTVERNIPWTPAFVLSYLRLFDSLQAWLIHHSVCMRHQEHKVFYLHLTQTLPSRAEGFNLPEAGYPVSSASSVGVISWVLPKVNIIDVLGLNDYVVARNPDLNLPIQMAHERRPPRGYVECFAANVVLQEGHFKVVPRGEELTTEKIRQCEQEYAAVVHNARPAEPLPTVQNPIDDPRFFVRQQYLDVLNREPDPDGLTYWSDHLLACPTGSYCFNDSRISIPIILSDPAEFQETALFAYRLYAVSFGTVPRFADFQRDRDALNAHQIDWRDPNDFLPIHQAFIGDWLGRDAFRAKYPQAMPAEDFINHIFDNANLKPFVSERRQLIDALRAGKSRAEVLGEIVEKDEFKTRVDEQSAVPMQLLMQLRRDISGDARYEIWLDKIKRREPVDARHVLCLILTGEEYQRRFGAVITHSNTECP